MASHFEQWEKDPFFPAAEEVQESADMFQIRVYVLYFVSIYFLTQILVYFFYKLLLKFIKSIVIEGWNQHIELIHALKEPSLWNIEELKRDLRTALGTAKWQLEEFEKAVEKSYSKLSCNDTKSRHREFITAMESQVSKVAKCLDDSDVATGKPPRPWVRLNEGESNELALFLSGSVSCGSEKSGEVCVNDDQSTSGCSKNVGHENKLSKHRRTASAGADIGAWNIAVGEDVSVGGLNEKIEQPPRKVPSFSGFLNNVESVSKLQWSKNGYRKLKVIDHAKLPEIQPLSRGINACYERSKSCLETGDDCYQKQLYG